MCQCYDCGLKYGSDGWVEAVIPDKIWNKLKPTECEDGCGILCITCIARRAKILKLKNIPVWFCGTENLVAIEGDPSENLSLLREFNVEEVLNDY